MFDLKTELVAYCDTGPAWGCLGRGGAGGYVRYRNANALVECQEVQKWAEQPMLTPIEPVLTDEMLHHGKI
jgi:hypothetical protein